MFGRLQQFDERSREYSIRRLLGPSTAQRSYTWACPVTLDQGNEGSCVGHAWAHELIARPSLVPGIDHRFATEQLYWVAQRLDPWEGGDYPGASKRYEGTSVLAGAKAAMTTGLIGGYYWAFGLDDLILGVGRRGPAVIGVNWYSGMQTPDRDGFIHVTGSVVNGHAVLARSVNLKQQRFIIRNSWGGSWGQSGDCYLSFDDMARLLAEGGDACFALGRRTQPLSR